MHNLGWITDQPIQPGGGRNHPNTGLNNDQIRRLLAS
jgi:hypothetical protein